MSKRKNTIIIICFVLVILLGAGAAAYPLIASINNEHTQSLVQTEYEEKIQQLDTSEIDAALEAAREYNKTISTVQIEDVDKIKADLPPYEDLLNLANNGIMGYIEIPAINIDLPIYHGTTGAAMEKGAGHMEGTSLPVGGIGTHAVISAHSGMASAKLFTDIDQLKVGDKFYIHVLDEVLAYKVDQILPMVRCNLGIGFCPEGIARPAIEHKEVFEIELEEEIPERQITIVEDSGKPQSIAVQKLLTYFK